MISLPKHKQVLLPTQVDVPIQYGGCREYLFAQRVPRQNLERVAAVEYHHDAFLRGNVDAAICADGGTVAIAWGVDALGLVKDAAGGRLVTRNQAAVLHGIDPAQVAER